MDYSKFMQFITQKALYFCGASKFEDPFEGQYAWGPTGNAEFIRSQRILHKKNGGGMDFEIFMAMNIKTLKDISSQTFINCWHKSEHESEAMWKLYCKNPSEGVAIKTTEAKLRTALRATGTENLYLNPVKYVRNYWIKQYNPENDVFFRKRSSFEHEKEFRAIFQKDPYSNSIPPHGHLVSININNLIDKIIVSPLANKSFYDLVNDSRLNAGVNTLVEKSEIEMQPQMSVEEEVLAEGEGYKQYAIRLIGKYS
jgi:hypothetical protein